MLSEIPQEFNKFTRNLQHLRRILQETRQALDEIVAANIFSADDIRERFFHISVSETLHHILNCHPALLVLGQSCNAKAKLINTFLGEELFPCDVESWRWVRISFGSKGRSSVVLDFKTQEIEVSQVPEEKTWLVVPVEDLHRPDDEKISLENVAMLQVHLCHPFLQSGVQLIVPPDLDCLNKKSFKKMLQDGLTHILPIILFAVSEEDLSHQNIEELRELKELYPELPVYFIYTSSSVPSSVKSCSEGGEMSKFNLQGKNSDHETFRDVDVTNSSFTCSTDRKLPALIHQLASLGYLHLEDSKECKVSMKPHSSHFSVGNVFLDDLKKLAQVVVFVHGCLQFYLVQAASRLNEVQSHCLRQFILSAFDMAREIQITPRRIQYAQEKEMELYKNLISITSEKQEEIRHIIESTLQEMKSGLVERAAEYQYHGITLSENEEVQSLQDVRVATSEIHYLVLSRLSSAVASQLMESVDCLRETFVGTLQRCLESLEKNCYEQEGNLLASDAFKQILSAAYSIELSSSSSSLLHSFIERLRKLLHAFQLPWNSPRRLDASWRRRVASEMLNSLHASRLAHSISNQFRERVRSSHEAFQSALHDLENHYSGHLERTEEQRIAIRKYHAPKLARLALDSTSLSDVVRYGVPNLGQEIGRGHYGVVFACESWGGTGPCAVKSVVPPDEKHWNDLAMEFYYTRTIAEHRHIVRLRGSVIDSSYGGGCTPSVLLIMDRLSHDLYYGLKSGLSWLVRLQISIDVVEGIRYLHSQGLVHRDIKLKNVLLDSANNAKLTDLGFCIPEAMMSGSIVGTPAHMAPELLSGHYDSSVDVYAFGILFWYICAGHVRLPYAFDQFRNKEQLWTSVKRGIRPEKLPYFDEDCWQLMDSCWAAEPAKRPLLGYVLPKLEAIKDRYS